jgi:lipopolysaccharide transport system permease protein
MRRTTMKAPQSTVHGSTPLDAQSSPAAAVVPPANGRRASAVGSHGWTGRLRHTFELLWELVLRDLRMRYMRSYLGVGWSLLNPLSQILIFSFLFGMVMPLAIENYTIFVFCGVLAWSWFSTSLIAAGGAVVASPELIRRPGFPVYVLPVVSVVTNAIQFLIGFPVLLGLVLIDGGQLGLALLAVPVVIAVQFVLTVGLAFPLAAMNVRYRDTQHVITLATMAAFYLTPVFYSAEVVPDQYQWLYRLNPMVTLLEAYRDILIRNQWPDFTGLFILALVAVPVVAVGCSVFARASLRFAEEL